MAFKKITDSDLQGLGVTGLPDVPGLETLEMQKKLDELPNYAIFRVNQLIDGLNKLRLETKVDGGGITNIAIDADGNLQVSFDNGESYVGTSSSGHLILNEDGEAMPTRSRLRFKNTVLADDAEAGETVVSGVKGDTGPRGEQGIQGEVGPQGRAGMVFQPILASDGHLSWRLSEQEDASLPAERNIMGPQGPQGIQGVQGEPGAKGAQGPQGVMGPTGPQGEAGATGATGPAGPRGIQGVKGETGAAGPQGPKGDTGPQGPEGPQGPAGAQGMRGEKGEKGDSGNSFTVLGLYGTVEELKTAHPTGSAGDAWAVGTADSNSICIWDINAEAWVDVGPLMGPAGPQGPQGETGPEGPQGATGPKGDTGAAGPQGPQGETGPEGAQGATGPKGDTGAVGPKGDKGDTGPKGDTGATGPEGPQGKQGIQGIQGPQGDKGAQGDPTIVNGKSGSSITLTGADIALTGYSKPSSGSAVAASDKVNAAIGKLEAKADAAQSSANGKAPKAHASTATTYGIGTDSNYGHLKLSDSTSSSSAAAAGVAASPKAVKAAYDLANSAKTALGGCWLEFTDEDGNPTDEPYIHWNEEV